MKNILVTFGILALLFEIYRLLRGNWIWEILKKKNNSKRPRKAMIMRPKNERDCSFCVEEKEWHSKPKLEKPLAWIVQKGLGGPKKKVTTEGYFCPNEKCGYYGITDEKVHALVGDGNHGKYEEIRDLQCQAYRRKFTVRRNTVLYRLKTHSGAVEKIMWLLGLRVDASALEEVFRVRESTIRTWLCRSGKQGRKLHERFVVEMELIHVQLDKLWVNMKNRGEELWLWVACDVKTKLVLVLQAGGRMPAMAVGLKSRRRTVMELLSFPWL
jgi:hypothetical protein